MSDYTREPDHEDFLDWAHRHKYFDYKEFYEEFVLPVILDLEKDDYFGTEGFDKRFC